MLIPKVSSAVTAKRTPVVKVSKCQILFTDSVFRHASVSSTYPGQSVRHGPTWWPTWRPKKMVLFSADVLLHMVADKVAGMVVDMGADKKFVFYS